MDYNQPFLRRVWNRLSEDWVETSVKFVLFFAALVCVVCVGLILIALHDNSNNIGVQECLAQHGEFYRLTNGEHYCAFRVTPEIER